MKKSYYFRKVLDYLGVTFLLGVLYFLWILYQGPLSVPFLKPYIVKALNSKQNEYTMDIGSVNIELVRSIQPIKIIAKNVLLRKNDNNITVKTPKLFMSFSVRALLKGMIAPSSINIRNPQVSIFTTYGVEKDKENEINRKKVEFYFDWFEGFLERFNSSDQMYSESYINEIVIKDASIEFHEVDLGRKWQLSNVDLKFNRNIKSLELAAEGVVDLGEKMATIETGLEYVPISKMLHLRALFADVVVSDFIGQIGKDVSSVDVPIEGEVRAEIHFDEVLKHKTDLVQSIDSALEKIEFQIAGSSGTVHFGDDEKFDYPIGSFSFEGKISGGLDRIDLKNAELMTDNKKVSLNFALSGYQKYFFEKSLKDLKINFSAKVDSLDMNDLSKFWPRYFGEPAWEWCKDGLYGGKYQNADFKFAWQYDDKEKQMILSSLAGTLDIENGTVFYLEGMPVVSGVYGKAKFKKGEIDIALDKGISEAIMVDVGRVRLYDLDKEENFIDIQIKGDSSIPDALKYIDHPPLELTKELKLKTEQIDGDVSIDLGLNFELYQDLKPEDIKVDVDAVLTDVNVAKLFDEKDLTAQQIDLKLENKVLTATGEAKLGDVPVRFSFKQNFDKSSYLGKGEFHFRFDDVFKSRFNLNSAFLDEPYVSGFADVSADVLIADEQKTEVAIDADLENMNIDYSFFGFVKPEGQKGAAKAKLVLKGGKLQSVSSFGITYPDFSMTGKASLNGAGALKSIDIDSIKAPKTSAALKIDFAATSQEAHKINISGNSYDLTELFSRREKKQKAKAKDNPLSEADEDLAFLPNVDVFMNVNSLWTNEKTPIKNFIGNVILKHGVGVEEVHLLGNHGSDKSIKLTLDYVPKKNGEHILNIDSNNAGSTLRVLRLYDNMSGGILKIEAKRGTDKKIIGHAKIRDFTIQNTPLMAKFLTVASFSGMLDLLKGDGLVFSHFDAPFSYKNKTLHINEAKMFGNVIGFTASGKVNRLTENIDIKGIVSPAYGLNSMVGKIPLVGKMLAGKDGTIFAANYEISETIDNPKISINPLSLLSPNSVKDLFSSEENDE
ncbi:MAG: AsmA-like C-terminal domain-containing protein [Alphaproteobacteria bacterium]|nr:AsmA-like C-terminal domain-containing protein [Alphaproteobacteria bacterium]